MKVNNLLTIIILILIAGVAYLAGSCKRGNENYSVTQTDTVYRDRLYTDTVIIHHYAKPKTVTVYLKANKPKREAMEQRTIIQGLRIEPKGVEVATIDTAGFTRVNYYPIAIGSEVLVNDTGAVQVKPVSIKKARWIKAGRVAVIVAAFGLGLLL